MLWFGKKKTNAEPSAELPEENPGIDVMGAPQAPESEPDEAAATQAPPDASEETAIPLPDKEQEAVKQAPRKGAQGRALRTAAANRTGGAAPSLHRPASRIVSPRMFWAVCVLCMAAIAASVAWAIPAANSPVILGDELGYWGNAAIMAGYDWHSVMSSIPFYSYGYSFFLVPLFWLGLPMAAMYKAALVLNIVFLELAFALTVLCLRRLFSALPPLGALLVATATTLYTNTVVQAQAAWSETLLYLVYWLLFFLVLRLLEKPTIPGSIAVALAGAYLYMVHMRTLGVLIALVITILLFWAAKRLSWRQVLAFALSFAALLVLQNTIKLWFNANVYVGESFVGANDYGGQINNMLDAFSTAEGWSSIFFSACGKMFYLATSTLLLGLVALRLLFVDSFTALWRWCKGGLHKLEARKLPALFLLLSFGGTFMINVISMRWASGRMDIPVYGRYMEFAFGPLIAIGLALLVLGRVNAKQVLWYGAVLLALAVPTNDLLIRTEQSGADNYNLLCCATWKALLTLHNEVPQFAYFAAGITLFIFLLLWAGQHWFGRCVMLNAGNPLRLRLAKATRPVLRVLLPCGICCVCWLWGAGADSATVAAQRLVTQALTPAMEIVSTTGQTPQVIYLVGNYRNPENMADGRHLQCYFPDVPVKIIGATEFSTVAHDANAWFVTAPAASSQGVVSEQYGCIYTSDALAIYAGTDSAWYGAITQRPVLSTADKTEQVYYSNGAVLEAGMIHCSEDDKLTTVRTKDLTEERTGSYYKEVVPSNTQREDGLWQTIVPVEAKTNGESHTAAYYTAQNWLSGQYEISLVLTLESATQENLGEFQIVDGNGTTLAKTTLSAKDFAVGTRTRITLNVNTMLDQQVKAVQMQVVPEAGTIMTVHEFIYARVGEATEVLTQGTEEMNQLSRLLALDYEYRAVYILPKPSQQDRASIVDLQASDRDRRFSLENNLSVLQRELGIVLIPSSRTAQIYQLLGSYVIAERIGDYTLLLPSGSGIASEFVGHGGTLMSDGYSVDLRYYAEDRVQPANSVSGTPPAGRYYVVAIPTFDNTLTGNYGTMELMQDELSLGTVRLDNAAEEKNDFYSPYTLDFDGTQTLSATVDSGLNARLQGLKVTLRRLEPAAATYGDQ